MQHKRKSQQKESCLKQLKAWANVYQKDIWALCYLSRQTPIIPRLQLGNATIILDWITENLVCVLHPPGTPGKGRMGARYEVDMPWAWKGRLPPWILKYAAKTVVFLVSCRKNQFNHFCPP